MSRQLSSSGGAADQLRDSIAFSLPAVAPGAAGNNPSAAPSQSVRRSTSYHSESSSLSEAEECDEAMHSGQDSGSDEGVAGRPWTGTGILLTGPAREEAVDAQLRETAKLAAKAKTNAARDKIRVEWMYRW